MSSIAVLRFANMSSGEETGFLAEGLSEDILDHLARQEGLKVASRSDSFQFSERNEDTGIIGEALGVAFVLEGSVRQQGDNVRITAQLVRAADGFHVWSKSYERIRSDSFDMQTDVATNIARLVNHSLSMDIGRRNWQNFPAFKNSDPLAVAYLIEAHDEFGKIKLGEGGGLSVVLPFLHKAVSVDPTLAAAYPRISNHTLTRYSKQDWRSKRHVPQPMKRSVAVCQWTQTHLHYASNFDSNAQEFTGSSI